VRAAEHAGDFGRDIERVPRANVNDALALAKSEPLTRQFFAESAALTLWGTREAAVRVRSSFWTRSQ